MRLSYRTVGLAFVALLLFQLLAAAINGRTARDDALALARESTERVGEAAAQSLVRFLDPAEQVTTANASLVQAQELVLREPALERYFYAQLTAAEQLGGVFVGFANGAFVGVSREGNGYVSRRTDTLRTWTAAFQPLGKESGTPFDPSTRPWWAPAVATAGPVWVGPYAFVDVGSLGLTVSQVARNDGEVTGVTGADITLATLDQYLAELPLGAHGEAYLLSPDGRVASASVPRADTATASLEELPDAVSLGLPADVQAGPVDTVTDDGTTYLVYTAALPLQPTGWTLVVRAPEADYTAAVRSLQRATLATVLVTAALFTIGTIFLVVVSRRLRELRRRAATDPLTGLPNRQVLSHVGADMLASVQDAGDRLSVLAFDLDGFKAVNDGLGHAAGDAVLRALADELLAGIRERDLAVRLGGDEFVVLQRVADAEAAGPLAARLHRRVSESLEQHDVGVSAGLAVSSGEASQSLPQLLADADASLLRVKHTAKGTLGTATPAVL